MKSKNAFLSLLRHLLTFGGGLVVANNPHVIDAPTMGTGIGAIMGVAGAAWGSIGAHIAEKKEKARTSK